MENISKPQERAENPSSSSSSSPSNSPTTTTTTNNGVVQIPSPKPTTPRSDPNNPYPTTFVQADTSNFKHVVQMLTGSTETIKQTPSRQPPQDQKNFNIPPKKQGFKLYERRNINNSSNNNNNHNHNLKNSLMINTLLPNSNFSPRKPEILSPSLLNFPSLTLSPVTPLNDDAFNKSMSSSPSLLEEEKAIAEKGFYLHPSPRETTEPPQLLPLFPVTSPRVSGSAASS